MFSYAELSMKQYSESDPVTNAEWEAYFHHQLLLSNGTLIIYSLIAVLYLTGIWSILKVHPLPPFRPMVTLCLINCICGLCGSIVIICYYFLFDINCIARNVFSLILFQISASCTDIVLLMRAYVACGRQRSLVYFGVVLCSSKYIPFGWVLANVSSSLSVVLHVCQYADLPSELNYVMIMDLVTNFFFCILFIIAIRKHIHLIKTEIEPALFQTDISHRMKSYYRIVKKTIHFFVISAVSMFVVILMTLLTNIHTNSTILPYYFGMAIATRFLTNAVMSFQRNDRPDSSSQTRTAVAGSNFDAAGEFSSEMPSIIISTSSIRGDSPPPSPNSEKYSLNEVIIDPKSTEQ